jgi:hypothetical protein
MVATKQCIPALLKEEKQATHSNMHQVQPPHYYQEVTPNPGTSLTSRIPMSIDVKVQDLISTHHIWPRLHVASRES